MARAAAKPLAMMLLVLALTLCFVQVPTKAAAISVTDKTNSFLQGVVGLDLSKYTIQSSVGPITDHPNDLCGLSRTTGEMTLTSGLSTIEVVYNYVNDSMVACEVDVRQGKMILTQSLPTETRLMVKDFLQKYGNFTGDSSTATMSALVDSVDLTKNSASVLNNLVLETSTSAGSSIFTWKVAYNGAVFSHMTLTSDNGTFVSLYDDRSYVTIGSTAVNVSKEEAISIALDMAKNYSWTLNGQKIDNFTILTENISPYLSTKGKDNPIVLYPYWTVTMPLDNVYPGFVTEIEVQIWADTGQVIAVYPLGIGGDLPPATTPSVSASPSASPEPTITAAPAPSVPPPPTTDSHSNSITIDTSKPSPSPSPTPSPSSANSPTQQPTAEPRPRASPTPIQETGNSNFTLEIIGIVVIAIVAVGLLVYFRKRRG